MIGCLRTRVRKQPIIALYFESENELKLYNLEARLYKSTYALPICVVCLVCEDGVVPIGRTLLLLEESVERCRYTEMYI